MNKLYNELINYIVELGDSIKDSTAIIKSDNLKDIKLNLDAEINSKIILFLKKQFSYPILSEEETKQLSFNNYEDKVWIVDPLDGSLNFSRGIPISCISIALFNGGKHEFGCIYDFNRKELFVAEENNCILNKNKITTSNIKEKSKGILCTGFPSWRNYENESLNIFLHQIKDWKKVRAIGSAALSLAWVARGWVDAYMEEDIRIWDVAAGLTLVKAAGGGIFIKENNRTNFVTAIATNGHISVRELV
ncbi:MAG: inositol monophosphatase [Candidatus Marinimicrobia bacterium]|jgi:myo-inositol-1(or 4)-monophosphatase|nr:inositol monophosphatase [Candidatus Neomarinimicrobiota bacterium]